MNLPLIITIIIVVILLLFLGRILSYALRFFLAVMLIFLVLVLLFGISLEEFLSFINDVITLVF